MGELKINKEIKTNQVRIVDSDKAGIYNLKDALKLAEDLGLDLVEINSNIYPSICKIFDYQKYQYQQKRKNKENKSKNSQIETKEIRLSYNIGDNDLLTKEKQAIKFLQSGNKVLISMLFKGRTIMHSDLGMEKMNTFISDLESYSDIDKKPVLDGKKITATLKIKKNGSKSKLD